MFVLEQAPSRLVHEVRFCVAGIVLFVSDAALPDSETALLDMDALLLVSETALPVLDAVFPDWENSMTLAYLPMQKCWKMSDSTSSLVMAPPVMAAR